ncbi:MAG: CPBP family intramembrane metalloprotease [Clostridiales bacterium]|nr:CPBP family intramembrane metalloprotease [Clostridiales bacterium]
MSEHDLNQTPDFAVKPKREYPTVAQAGLIMLGLTVWFFVVQYLLVFVIQTNADIMDGFQNNATVYYFINAVYQAALLGLPILLIFSKFKGSTEKLARFNGISSKEIVIVVVLGLLMYVANALLSSASVELASIFTNVEIPEVPPVYETTDIITMMLLYVVIAPVFEEIIFRGIIMRGLEGVSKWFAIIVTAALFSLFHLSYYTVIPKFLGGVLLGYVVFATDSLYSGIVIHLLNNAISGILTIIYDNSSVMDDAEAILGEVTLSDQIVSIVLTTGMSIGIIVVIIAVLAIMRNSSRTPDGEGGYIHKGKIREKYDCEKPVAIYKYIPIIISVAVFLAFTVIDIISCWK